MWQAGVLVLVITLLCANAQRMRRCTTPNGEQASCQPLKDCKILLDVIHKATNTPSEIKFLQTSLCYKDQKRQPVVCCGSDSDFITASTNSILPDRQQCGYQEDPYNILNGDEAGIIEFPWLALLAKKNSTGHVRYTCGGTLISDRYVLTAAHCVSGLTGVRLGEWDLETTEDCIASYNIEQCAPRPQDIGIEEVISHKSYKRFRTGAAIHDIALLRLASPASISPFVRPICLPLSTQRSSPGERLYVAGWGAVSEKKSSSAKKQRFKIPIVEQSACSTKFRSASVDLTDDQFCAGGEKDRDSCKGDSGGPLMTVTKTNYNQYYIEGVVSFDAICGSEGYPGIYTRVSNYLDWIQQNVRP